MAIQCLSVWWVAVTLLLSSPHVHSRNVTRDDGRDIAYIVRAVRAIDDHLTRHEYREKGLGEELKRTLAGLDKQHRSLEPFKGTISRLDERLSHVETTILQKDEREKITQKKTNEALESIQKTLQALTLTIETMKQAKETPEIDNNLTLDEESPMERKLDATNAKIDALKLDIENLKHSMKKETLRAVCSDMAYNVNPLEKHMTEAEKLLNKYELKLIEYDTVHKADVAHLNEVPLADEAWHSKMAEVMNRQEEDIKKIQKLLTDAESMWKELPKRTDLQTATTDTLTAVSKITRNINESTEASIAKIEVKLREMGDRLVSTNVDIQRSLTDGNTLTERAYSDVARNYEALLKEIQTLKKNENTTLHLADTIATKKGVEYGVYQILTEVGELVKIQARSMNRTVNDRFDIIETTLMASQKRSLANVSAQVETEMSQVWQQIAVMHQQLMDTTMSLNKLINETQQYVTSSTKTMNRVKDKVDDISTRIFELSSNLNDAVGRLAVASHEFGLMSSGLAEIYNTQKHEKKIEDKISDPSPGPHNITSTDGGK